MGNFDCMDMITMIKKISAAPRFVGSENSAYTKKIVTSCLQKKGYRYTLSSTIIPNWSINGLPTIQFLTPEEIEINGIPAILSLPTPPEGIEGKIVGTGHLKMLESFDWERYTIVDKNRRNLGCLISTSYGSQTQPLPPEAQALPHVILDSNTLKKLHVWIQSGLEIFARVKNPTKLEGNVDVVSVVTEAPPRPHAFICTHYDTVLNSVGAHDNASGVAVVLRLAHTLASSDVACRFAFFDGEEVNKVGSQRFVIEEKRKQTFENISFVLEIDAVGIGNEIALLCSKNLYKRLQKLQGHLHKILLGEFKISISRQSKIGFSDVWPFMKEGLPVIRMLTRGDNGRNIIHTDEDTPDKIKTETLSAAFNIAYTIVAKFGVKLIGKLT